MRSWIVPLALFIGCGGNSPMSHENDSTDGGSPSSDASPMGPDGAPGEGPVTFHIEFDYRFDESGFFLDPDRRATLERAAQSWGRIFDQDFPTIPEGTQVRTRDPEAPDQSGTGFAIDRDIDDLLIFVGCADLDGPGGNTAVSSPTAALAAVADAELAAELTQRYQGTDFQPWTGWISFDCQESWYFDQDTSTDDDIPASDCDFWSVAMHEIGHVLGFGTADAFMLLREEGPMRFVGQAATAEYGGDVPLSAAGTHFQSGLLSDGQETLLDPGRAPGVRTPPTPLDIAVLVDLGHDPAP